MKAYPLKEDSQLSFSAEHMKVNKIISGSYFVQCTERAWSKFLQLSHKTWKAEYIRKDSAIVLLM